MLSLAWAVWQSSRVGGRTKRRAVRLSAVLSSTALSYRYRYSRGGHGQWGGLGRSQDRRGHVSDKDRGQGAGQKDKGGKTGGNRGRTSGRCTQPLAPRSSIVSEGSPGCQAERPRGPRDDGAASLRPGWDGRCSEREGRLTAMLLNPPTLPGPPAQVHPLEGPASHVHPLRSTLSSLHSPPLEVTSHKAVILFPMRRWKRGYIRLMPLARHRSHSLVPARAVDAAPLPTPSQRAHRCPAPASQRPRHQPPQLHFVSYAYSHLHLSPPRTASSTLKSTTPRRGGAMQTTRLLLLGCPRAALSHTFPSFSVSPRTATQRRRSRRGLHSRRSDQGRPPPSPRLRHQQSGGGLCPS